MRGDSFGGALPGNFAAVGSDLEIAEPLVEKDRPTAKGSSFCGESEGCQKRNLGGVSFFSPHNLGGLGKTLIVFPRCKKKRQGKICLRTAVTGGKAGEPRPRSPDRALGDKRWMKMVGLDRESS